MKVLVFAHRLELGGTQTNAIELTAAMRDQYGHDVVMFATPGPALELAREHSLRVVEAPDATFHPSLARMRALARVVREHRPDLVHVWDWPQCFDAYFGVHLVHGVPMLATMMGMTVESFVPRNLPATLGTRALQAQASLVRKGPVALLEPPVDVTANAPGAVDPREFLARHGLGPDRLNVVVVTRLEQWLKLESLLRAMDAVAELAPTHRLRLVIVGEGSAQARVAQRARQVNDSLGAQAVVLTGPLVDPRPAYAAADIMLGMGGSALRSLAFAKPLVVLGEQGFSEPFTPETAGDFLWQGFYGKGDGQLSAARLVRQLRPLLSDPDLRARLGQFGRQVVVDTYALDVGAARLDELYRDVAVSRPSRAAAAYEGARLVGYLVAGRALSTGARRRIQTVMRGRFA